MKAKDLADLLLKNPEVELVIDMPVATPQWDGTELETILRGRIHAVDFEIADGSPRLVLQSGA